MAHKRNTITINGKVYDTSTGAVVNNSAVKSSDGIIAAPKAPPKHAQAAAARTATSSKSVHSSLTRSKTLMRRVVQKPAEPVARPSKAHPALHTNNGTGSPYSANVSTVPASRLKHAQQTSKSTLVNHFNAGQNHVVVKRTEAVRVKTAPAKATHHTPKTAPRTQSDKDVLLSAAMLRSMSHEQPNVQLSKRRHRVAHKFGLSPTFVTISAAVIAVIAIGGFVAYQNIPQFAMQIAASKAGIAARLPGYHPQGFALADAITYSTGKVTYSYRARDNRSYQVTQTRSDFNSESLASVLGASTEDTSTPYQVRGRTVYISEGSNATWVDGGIWYAIEGNSVLSTDQLLKIVASF